MDAQGATRRWQQHRQRGEGCDWCGVMSQEKGGENVPVFCPACVAGYEGVKQAINATLELLHS